MSEDVLTARSRMAHLRREQTHYVYSLWSRRECLYVGVTSNLGQRLSTHGRKDWWSEVARVVVDAHVDKRAGLLAEKDLIEELGPIMNRHGVL